MRQPWLDPRPLKRCFLSIVLEQRDDLAEANARKTLTIGQGTSGTVQLLCSLLHRTAAAVPTTSISTGSTRYRYAVEVLLLTVDETSLVGERHRHADQT